MDKRKIPESRKIERKKYLTTGKHGFWVAGRKIPSVKKENRLVPMTGHPMMLTDAEAKYELLVGAIMPAETPAKQPSK